MEDEDDDDTVVGTCLHCNAPPPPRSSGRGGSYSGGEGRFLPCPGANAIVASSTGTPPPAAARVQVSCDDCRAFICDACHWCHEFQANHEIRVCDRCDAFYCRGCDEMDQCEDCSEVVCNTCSTLMSCKFCGCGLCEDCATACGRCGIVLCARDAKFAVECDTCRMPYCLVCLASGTKDPCVRCGHRPSKRMEQLVHLRLKSIYKAFKQSGASGHGPGNSGAGGSGSSGATCRIADGGGSHGPTMGGKYSSALRSLTEGGTDPPQSKDNFTSFDQSMASEVAAVLQTASNSLGGPDGDDARRARGKRPPLPDGHGPLSGGARNRAASRASTAAAERYFRKTQAEMEAAAAAAEAEAEAAAAALLAELDEEQATNAANSKKNKKLKMKKKKRRERERKKEAAAELLPPAEVAASASSAPSTDKTKNEPQVSASQKDSQKNPQKNPQKNSQKKKGAKKVPPERSKGPLPAVPIEDDSSDEDMNFEQIVGKIKVGTRPSKKEKKEENNEVESKPVAPAQKPKAEANPPAEDATTTTATTADFDAELAVLLSNEDEEGLQTFLANLKGVPGLGAARKTAKKAIKRIKEARQPPAPVQEPEKPEKLSQNQGKGITSSSASNAADNETNHEKSATKPKSVHQKQSSRAGSATVTAGNVAPNPPPSAGNQLESLLRIVSRTQSNAGSISNRVGTSNSTSIPVSARAECVMHMSPAVVGWVIGKGGSRIRDMMEESGAKIWIDQESMTAKEARVVYVSGKRSSVDTATRMVKDLVSKAPVANAGFVQAPVQASSSATLTSAPSGLNPLPPEATKEPTSFAEAIGSGASTPTTVTPPNSYPDSPTKQAAPVQSWAVPAPGGNSVTIPLPVAPPVAPQSVKLTPPLGITKRFEAGGTKLFPDMLSAEMECDPRFVALLIGRRGWTVKNIQAESGADLRIDQSVDPPKIIISGRAEGVKKAERMVRDVLKYPQSQLHQQSSQQQPNNDTGLMNGTSNFTNGKLENTTDKQINPHPPLRKSVHTDASSSTPTLLEELQFQHDSTRESRTLHPEGAMNLPTLYPQYLPQQDQNSLGLFRDSSPATRIPNFMPNQRHRSQQLPVNVDRSTQNQSQEWSHHSQAPAQHQYSTLPPFTSGQDNTRDQYSVSTHNVPLVQQSLHNDSSMSSTFALPPAQHHHFSQNLDPVHQPPMQSSQVSSTRVNEFISSGGPGHNINSWELAAKGGPVGEHWDQQSHQQPTASTHQQTNCQPEITPALSNNPFQHQTQTHLGGTTSSQPTNNRVSDDSLMVDNMFASLGTSRDGDGLLSALNSVSLGGTVSRQSNNESKIASWASEGSSSMTGSRLANYTEER